MAKLIVLNGPCGIGKNTIAQKYLDREELTLLMDIDEIRRFLGNHRQKRAASAKLASDLACVMTERHLENGYDVIVPNSLRHHEHIDVFKSIAEDTDSEYFEVMLWADKQSAIDRAVNRGFIEGNLLQESDLEPMYEELVRIKDERDAIVIDSIEDEVEATYAKFMEAVS